MGVLSWLLVGVIAGAIAARLTRRVTALDYTLNIAVGIVGAAVGGFITNLVIFRPVFSANLQNGLVSVFGAALFLVLANLVRR